MPENSEHPLDSSEVTEQSISEILSKDIQDCSEADLNQMIETVRQARHIWQQEETSAKSSGRRTNHNKGLTLKDLDIDI